MAEATKGLPMTSKWDPEKLAQEVAELKALEKQPLPSRAGGYIKRTGPGLLQSAMTLGAGSAVASVVAGVSCAVGAVTLAALAMTASLYLPRIATVLLVFVATGATTLANLLAMFRDSTDGVMGAIDLFGPPLCTSIAVALSPWIDEVSIPGSPEEIAIRHALWAAASVALLVAVFRSVELRD